LPDRELSQAERRRLQSFPKFSADTVLSGKFMKDFESYTLDHFPLRDGFRALKGKAVRYGLMQKENNGFFSYDGYIIKQEYPMDETSIDHATGRFDYIYRQYLQEKETKVYLALVPDKNAFVPRSEGHLAMDYDLFAKKVRNQMDYAQYIDLFPHLSLSDYYATDTHWRQEKLTAPAKIIAQAMGAELKAEYQKEKVDLPFYGVYHGQSALAMPPDDLYYLSADFLKDCTATDRETNQQFPIYDMEKLQSHRPSAIADPYELFLSGPNRAIVELENPNATSEKELIIFRDSYANAIAPLLLEGYQKITLVDLRRVSAQFLGPFLEFDGQDVLFLQSTLVLNDSSEIK
jgi:hypothetical protein